MSVRPDDPLIDSLLEETLGGTAPPDLSARILHAWKERHAGNGQAAPPLNVFADITNPLPPPIVAGTVQIVRDPAPRELGRGRSRVNSHRFPLQLWASLGAVAAVLLIGYIGVQMSRSDIDVEVATHRPSRNAEEIARNGKTTPDISPPEVRPENVKVTPSPSELVGNHNTTPEVVESPTETPAPRHAASDAEVIAFINHELQESWQEHGVKPAAVASDSEWCRRTYLRLIGRIPTVEELQAFADDKSADKNERLVDRLLGDEQYAAEFARHWSEVWANLLLGRSLGNSPQEPASRAGLQEYLQASLRQNKPYDRMALELISATGAGQPGADNFNGAANFLLAHATDDASVATARTSRVFLGVQLQCVQCHDHPTAPLQQNSFWALNAFFRQMKVDAAPNGVRQLVNQDYLGVDGRDEDGRVFYDRPNGLVKVAGPAFLDGKQPEKLSGRIGEVNRREQLATMVVESKYFSQATMNRLWSQFLGFGFTRPVDAMISQAPSHPELLDRVSEEFAASGYDLKRAMRWIALSDAFNRTSKIGNSQVRDMPEAGTVALFSHYYTRQLQAEEVFRSLQIAAKLRQESGSNIEQARLSWLAARKTGDDENPGSPISLPIVRQAVSPSQNSLLQSVLNAKLTFEVKVEHLFLAALSRKPAPQELDLARALRGMNEKDEDAALEDIWWALLNSSEFLLDH